MLFVDLRSSVLMPAPTSEASYAAVPENVALERLIRLRPTASVSACFHIIFVPSGATSARGHVVRRGCSTTLVGRVTASEAHARCSDKRLIGRTSPNIHKVDRCPGTLTPSFPTTQISFYDRDYQHSEPLAIHRHAHNSDSLATLCKRHRPNPYVH